MADKPWWESRLDWTLPENLETTLRMGRNLLRNIPATISAYRLGKASPLDELEPDPVERIGAKKQDQEPQAVHAQSKARPAPKVIPPPPPPPPPPVQWGVPRAINMPPAVSKPAWQAAKPSELLKKLEQTLSRHTDLLKKLETSLVIKQPEQPEKEKAKEGSQQKSEKKLTLEQLLDPDFCKK
jgi:hypothetical protein